MILQFPVWSGLHKRLLSEVVSGVPENVNWRLRWFDGVVGPSVEELPPQNCDIDLPFSHAALLYLATNLTDLNEIALEGNCGNVRFVLECVDSTLWMVRYTSDDKELVERWFRAFLYANLSRDP